MKYKKEKKGKKMPKSAEKSVFLSISFAYFTSKTFMFATTLKIIVSIKMMTKSIKSSISMRTTEGIGLTTSTKSPLVGDKVLF